MTEAPDRSLGALLAVCLAASLSLGVAKLFVAKAHPPSWATPTRNTYGGFVSIDRYCLRAERIRDRLVGRDPGGEALLSELRESGHATAILIPGCVAALSLATGSIVFSFALLSGAALVLQVLLVFLLATRLAPSAPRRIGLAAGILVAGHCDSARTAAQLLLDPFTAAAATLVVLLSLRWLERRSVPTTVALLTALIAVPFLKLAALPLLAVPALLALVVGAGRRRSVLAGALAVGLLPLVVMLIYTELVLGTPVFSSEIGAMFRSNVATTGSILHFGLEMALLVQLMPIALLLAPAAVSREGRGGLIVALVLLLSVAVVRLHDDMRLYLPVLGLLAAAAAPALSRLLPGRRLLLGLLLFASANLALAALGLLAQAG